MICAVGSKAWNPLYEEIKDTYETYVIGDAKKWRRRWKLCVEHMNLDIGYDIQHGKRLSFTAFTI